VQIDSSSDLLRPGMSANTEILVRNAVKVMAVAQECIFEKDSVKIVYKKDKHGFQPIPVAPLLQDDDFVVIYSTLTGGEKLALREPANTKVDWPEKLIAVVAPAEVDTFKVVADKKVVEPPLPSDRMKKMKTLPQGSAPFPGRK